MRVAFSRNVPARFTQLFRELLKRSPLLLKYKAYALRAGAFLSPEETARLWGASELSASQLHPEWTARGHIYTYIVFAEDRLTSTLKLINNVLFQFPN